MMSVHNFISDPSLHSLLSALQLQSSLWAKQLMQICQLFGTKPIELKINLTRMNPSLRIIQTIEKPTITSLKAI